MCKALDIAKQNIHRFPPNIKIKCERDTVSINQDTFLAHYEMVDMEDDYIVGWVIYELFEDSYKILQSGWYYQ